MLSQIPEVPLLPADHVALLSPGVRVSRCSFNVCSTHLCSALQVKGSS